MPTVDLTDEDHAAVTAAIRRVIEDDKFPHAPRLDPLRSALAKLDPAAAASQPCPTAKNPKGRPRPGTMASIRAYEGWWDLSLIDDRNERPLDAAFVAVIAAWGMTFLFVLF
jgi:hypothetical protein